MAGGGTRTSSASGPFSSLRLGATLGIDRRHGIAERRQCYLLWSGEGPVLVAVEPQQRFFGGGGERAAQKRRHGVADLLQNLPFAALEFKPIVEGLQPGGL